ncbi:MAG: mechanosensitive ion channel family protein [Chloroflexi bacterium]|nr:mechanosensitive ion channel family protein [Chloroflexota bacterium]
MSEYLDQILWVDETIRILIYFASAWLLAFLLKRLVRRAMRLGQLAPRGRKPSPERQKTLQSLVSSAINLIVFIIAALASLGLFIQSDTLVWMVGLFSAAFGLGARPLISDYLAGLSFIFEDTFAVGEKIELPGPPVMEGVVEAINLRTTLLRSPTGELYVVPNGEIRTVRNFSRGKFSIANITLKISASDLGNTIAILEALGEEAVLLLPNLIEPWQVISPEGMIGQYTELTLVAKARFAKAADMRPRLLNLAQERMAEAGIALAA